MNQAKFGKVEVEIVYCVPCSYHNLAFWMASEIWRGYDPGDVAIKLTPDAAGKLEMYLDGQKIYDKKEEGKYPDYIRINELKMVVGERIFEIEDEIQKNL